MSKNYVQVLIILRLDRKINYHGTTGLDELIWVLVRAMIPTTAGNKAVRDPNFLKTIEDYTKKYNCEAAYFTEVNGNRTFVFVLDLPGPDMIPAILEPLFQGFDTNVEIHPTMNLDDLKKAISKI